jgi:chemotaxis-related protein WspD
VTDFAAIDPAWQAEWTAAAAAPLPVRETGAQASLLEFRLGREAYALPVRDVGAASELAPIVALPGRRERVVFGLFHLDGQLLLAADLARLLQPAQAPAAARAEGNRFPRVLILGHGGDSFAAVVDDVPGTFRQATDALGAIPVTAPAGTAAIARGLCRRGDRTITVLDGDKLLAALAQDLK